MTKIIPLGDLRSSPSAHSFEGFAHGAGVSFIMVESAPGAGPSLHTHPYPETFLVIEGNALYRVGEEEIRVSGGCVIVVPANTPHAFTNLGPGRLLQVDIHAADRFETVWLEDKREV